MSARDLHDRPEQIYLPIHAEIRKVDPKLGVEREKAIRLYCSQVGTAWKVQVRAPMTLHNGREGKDFVVATGTLGMAEMRALRDAIDAEIAFYDQFRNDRAE